MIELTKINGEPIVVNCRLIEYIVTIPETKVIMSNGRYHLVKESSEEIIRRSIDFEREIAEGLKESVCPMTGIGRYAVCADPVSEMTKKEED